MGQRAGGRNSAEPRRAAARPSPARRAGRLDVLDGPWGVVRVVRHDALVLVAAAVRDASELRHAREAGAGATRRRGCGRCGRCGSMICGIRLARGSRRA